MSPTLMLLASSLRSRGFALFASSLASLAVPLLTGCASSDSTGGAASPETGADAGDAAATDAPFEAADATPDGDGAASACPQTLTAACAAGELPGEFGVACVSTWDAAITDQHYCGSTVFESRGTCGAYVVRVATNVDFSYLYFYDAASGALVAVFSDGLVGGLRCVGGPASFTAPTCGALVPLDPCPTDGGAGSGDAG